MKYKKLIFVTGFPRSGTTLLQRLIAGGENHGFFPECNAISQLLRAYRTATSLSEGRIKAYFGSNNDIQTFYRATVDALIDKLLSNKEPRNILVLKDPLMLDVAAKTIELYPDAILIVNLRDPLDIVASRKEVAQRRGDEFNLSDVVEKTRVEAKHAKGLYNKLRDMENVLFLRYENLCLFPDRSIETLTNKLGYPIDQELQASSNPSSPFVTDLENESISPSSIKRHMVTLDSTEHAFALKSLSTAVAFFKNVKCINDLMPDEI